MNRLIKRLLCGAVSIGMVMSVLVLPQQALAANDPVVSITFDEGGDTYTLEGGASLVEGRDGQALSLNGNSQYATINGIADKLAAVTGDFTISVWTKPNAITTWTRIYDFGNGSSGTYAFLTPSNGTVTRLAVTTNGIDGEQHVDANTALVTGAWQNVAITRSSGHTTMYIDGFSVCETDELTYNFSDIGTMQNYYLGKSQFADDPYYSGLIDDFKVYDRALDEDEIHTLAAEAYEAKKNAAAFEDNCYIAETHFYSGDTEIFVAKDLTAENLTITVNVKNHTMNSGSVTAAAYVGSAAIDTDNATINSIDESTITLTVPKASVTGDVTVKLTTPNGEETATDTAGTLYHDIDGPVTAKSDPENGAHDPSIVKFPNDDTYYVYTSHHLIFTSKDLINWEKHDFAGTYTTNTEFAEKDGTKPNAGKKQMLDKTLTYMKNNSYGNINGTYWAPDVIYRPDDTAHPYWMYISVSCEVGGMNSVIGLIKSSSPLFWDDPDADIVDDGVVFATKNGQSKTNAIDVNIYTDSKDGQKYYIWGSFWGGIQAAPLTDNGLVKGVTYGSDGNATLASSKDFGTSVFTQPGNGTAGPEGAWMFEHGDYRYMFTSYGWLGSNYNTRIARSPLSTSFGTNMGTQLVDANGTVMGTAITDGNLKSVPTGYKLIGSYRLGDGSRTIVNDTHDYYVQSNSGDAITYYGPGHNSAISRGDESFYVSHTRVNHAEGGATLQVRKMLFTSDGWPVVAPVTYCGEVEQALPKDMIVGTYDLASVGQTKRGDGDIGAAAGGLVDVNRNYDLPVLSSKVTLGADMKMTNADGAEIGTWTYDNDHTVTLTFTANGDTSGNKDEFYKSGDTMTLYAMLEYDRDAAKPVIGLTGTDQNHITQLATKSAVNVLRTEPETIAEPAAKSITKSAGGNPELGFDTNGNTVYAGDPAATVIGDTVYLIVGHDTTTDSVTNADAGYTMPNWLLYTSQDMTNWEYKGPVLECKNISWASNKNAAWASQMVPYHGKYYLYFCTWDSTSSGKQSIGVAVANAPEGPYTDIGHPLVKGDFTTPESSGWNDIDPTVLIDEDADGNEHRYLAWGNGKYYVCELNEDMTSIKDMDGDGEIVMHKDVKEKKIKSMGGGVFTEAPWLYKRGDKYYMFYAMNWREEMAYAMTDDPFNGRYDFKQIIMPPTATSNTNHPSVIEFKGKTYFIYHNGALPNGFGFRRSVCIDELKFDDDGYVYPVTETSIGLTGTASVIKTSDGKYVGHSAFENSLGDAAYPMHTNVTVSDAENAYATAWEIMPAKAKKGETDYANYVSIQSVDKPGLYISSTGTGVELTQDIDNKMNDKITFKTVEALNSEADGVSFVSVSDPGKYLTVLGDALTLSFGQDANASTFTIDAATATPNPVINVATPEADPQPGADITQDFNTTAGTLISATTSSAKTYTALEGVTLYIDNKDSDNQPAQNFAIQSGGRSGNALVLNAGKYQSASRGGRVQINTPVIPDGYIATASIWVKQGKAGSVLRYNDSTSAEAGTELAGLTTEYRELVITIKNDGDVYTRTMTFGGNTIFTDYVDTFPVFWGTTANSTGQSIYFDDLSIITEPTTLTGSLVYTALTQNADGSAAATVVNNKNGRAKAALISAAYADNRLLKVSMKDIVTIAKGESAELSVDAPTVDGATATKVFLWDMDTYAPIEEGEPLPGVTLPDPAASFSFDGNLTDSVSEQSGTLTGALITQTTTVTEATYVAGASGEADDKAVSFTGEGSYGVALPTVVKPSGSNYTVSFDANLNASTQYTPFVFMANYDGSTLKGEDTNAEWISIASQGWQEALADGPMIWSRDVPGGKAWNDLTPTTKGKLTLNAWHNVTVAASGSTASIYVDGAKVGSGDIADVIDDTTRIFLGVNNWNTPLNGAIDNLKLFNETLSDAQVKLLCE